MSILSPLLSPLTLDYLITLQSTQFANQAAINPSITQQLSDTEGDPLGDAWFAQAMLALIIDINLQYTSLKARLATSTGADVDSFVNAFGLYRDSAIPATGQVNVYPNSVSTVDIFIPIGALCQTESGLQFQVIADSTQSAYVAGAGYKIPAGTATTSYITITVGCLTDGTIGNVAIGAINETAQGLGTPAFPSATITNAYAFINGIDGETDAALIARFTAYMQSGRFGTYLAIQAAIESAQTGLTFQIGDCLTTGDSTQYGYFTVFVNNIGQAGGASSATLAAVTAAIAPIKACGVGYTVASPTITNVNLSAQFVLDQTYLANPANSWTTIQAAITTAYTNYVNNIGLSVTNSSTLLSYAKVASILVSVPGIVSIPTLTLNSGTTDITAAYGHQLVAGTLTLSHT